jgi:hypothetical protein
MRTEDRKVFRQASGRRWGVAHNIHECYMLDAAVRPGNNFRRSVIHLQIHAINVFLVFDA